VLTTRGSIGTRLARLEEQARRPCVDVAALDRLRAEPNAVMAAAGMPPDPWQERVLTTDANQMMLLCGRQMGKSSVSAALALSSALLVPDSPVLLLSPSDRQSAELFRKVVALYDACGRPVPTTSRTARRLELSNGSRVVSLPGTERTVRGFSEVSLLVIDEAARVDDALYYAVRPMLAVSGGRLVVLSTPYGKQGWFHDEWHSEATWERIRVPATDCPRISAEFLESERRSLGKRWFAQEYLCEFAETFDAVFSWEVIQAARTDNIEPLFSITPEGELR
jgi:hypothetical protein